MANQPPVRPWSRLASLRSVTAPAPAPAPESRPPSGLPTLRTASAPTSPQTQPSQPSKPTPPPPSQASEPAAAAAPPRLATVVSAAQSVGGPPQKVPAPSASLPTFPVQKAAVTTSSSVPSSSPSLKATQQHSIGHHEKQVTGTAKEIEKKGKDTHRKLLDSEDSSAGGRVITLAGENRGAYMEIIQSPKKPNHLHKKGNSNTKTVIDFTSDYESENGNSSKGEGNANRKEKSHHYKGRTISSTPMTVYMNSNVQSVNNSLLYNTSCSHHDPGVHLSLSEKPFGDGFHLKERVKGQQN